MKIQSLLVLTLATMLVPSTANAGASGDKDTAVAIGYWETAEAVTVFCSRTVTTEEAKSGSWESVCFLTEVDNDKHIAVNVLSVTEWDVDHLVATETLLVNDKGEDATSSDPNAIKVIMTLRFDFKSRVLTKTNSIPGYQKQIVYHLSDHK